MSDTILSIVNFLAISYTNTAHLIRSITQYDILSAKNTVPSSNTGTEKEGNVVFIP